MFQQKEKMFHVSFLQIHETFFIYLYNKESVYYKLILSYIVSELFFSVPAGKYQIYSQQYQWDTQQLSYIQSHPNFFCNLWVLNKLKSQTGAEEYQQRNTCYESYVFL